MPIDIRITDKAPVPLSPISQATQAGGFLFTSGILGRSTAGDLAEGMGGQARQALENLKVIVEGAGGSLQDVLRCEVFVADLSEMPIFNSVWNEYFPQDPPARISMEVSNLAGGARVELTAVAFLEQRRA